VCDTGLVLPCLIKQMTSTDADNSRQLHNVVGRESCITSDLAVKGSGRVSCVHVYEAQLWVEVTSEEVEITHVAIDVVHLICSRRHITNSHHNTAIQW